MKKHIPRMRSIYVVIISLLLITTLFISGFIELSQSKAEILNLMNEQAATLLESISISAANAIKSYDEIELLLEQKLLLTGYLVDQLDQAKKLTNTELSNIAEMNHVYRINIFNKHGERELSSFTGKHIPELEPIPHKNLLDSLLQGTEQEKILGYIESRHSDEQRFAVAVKRTKGGAIVVNIDAEAILDFRKSIGVGRLMQDIGHYQGIEYIVLQDLQGIILATTGVTRMNSIPADSFLSVALETKKPSSRFIEYNKKNIFEFVGPFIMENDPIGLFRIGFTTDPINQASQRMRNRLIIMFFSIGFFLLLAFNFMTISQNYRAINDAYRRIQTYSGNILEHMTDAVIAINKSKYITIVNSSASQLFQARRETMIDKPVRPEFTFALSPLIDTLQTGTTFRDKEQTLQLNNRRLVISISTSIIKNENGDIDSAFAVIKDWTEKRQMEETLQRKEKLTAMGQLASGVAHEIRNPLNSIGMISQRLNKEFKPQADEDEYHQLTKTMVIEVHRINLIIQQFLKFARPPKLHLQKSDINSIIESVILLVKTQANDKNIKIQKDLSSIPAIDVDANQIKQALLNIIQNSIEAIENNGIIKLRTSITENELIIEIRDSGPGIDEEIKSKIFNLYFTTKTNGTGLGLSLVHQIISQHNGRIDVQSDAGQGTKFIIHLPGE